jgi:deazaflavin-dependent oxidoreductase (nitroreductase family)
MAGSDAKDRIIYPLEKRVVNPIVLLAWDLGLPPPGDALLETTGRRTGQPRRTPVCDGLDGDTFWLVAQRGHGADWVRNIAANPRASGSSSAAVPASAGGPGQRTSSTMTTRASGSGSWPRPTSRAVGVCARRRRWTPAR